MKELLQVVPTVELDCGDKTDGDELQVVVQAVTLQHTAVWDVGDLIWMDNVLGSVNDEHGAALQNIPHHAVRDVALRINPALLEKILIHIEEVKPHGGV